MMKKLLPLFGILVAAILVMSTGAFTSVTADRSATINVVGDASAILGINPAEGPNGKYAGFDESGKFFIDIGNVAKGVNADAEILIEDLFTITNNGTQDVLVTLLPFNGESAVSNVSLSTTSFTLAPGQMQSVSMKMDTEGLSEGDSVLTSININATAV